MATILRAGGWPANWYQRVPHTCTSCLCRYQLETTDHVDLVADGRVVHSTCPTCGLDVVSSLEEMAGRIALPTGTLDLPKLREQLKDRYGSQATEAAAIVKG